MVRIAGAIFDLARLCVQSVDRGVFCPFLVVAWMDGRRSLAIVECGYLLRGGFLVAKDWTTQPDPADIALAGFLAASAIVARELQQWPGQPIGYRPIDDCDFGCPLETMDTLRRLHWYLGLPENLPPLSRLVAGANLSAPAQLAPSANLNRPRSATIHSSAVRLRARAISALV